MANSITMASPPISALLLPIIVIWVVARYWSRKGESTDSLKNLPHVKFEGDNSPQRYQTSMIELLGEGYNKYHKQTTSNGEKGIPFTIPNPFSPSHPFVILPFRYYDQLKFAPESSLSFSEYLNKIADMKAIGIPTVSREAALSARVGLNRALSFGNKMEKLNEACVQAFGKYLDSQFHQTPTETSSTQAEEGETDTEKKEGNEKEWKTLAPYPIIMQVFAHMSAVCFVGEELGQLGGEWQALTFGYVNKTMATLQSLKGKWYPKKLLFLSRYFDKGVKSMAEDRRKAGELLRQSLETRLNLAASSSSSSDTTAEKEKGGPGWDEKKRRGTRSIEDGIQWLVDVFLDQGVPRSQITPDLIQNKLISLVFASIHSTSQVALTLLFDMIEHPADVLEIREEIARVRKRNNMGDDGMQWTRQALGELRLLDSFMRESVRIHGSAQILSMQRVVQVPYTFRDGLTVPAGGIIALDSYHHSHDPENHGPNPDAFDARRHLRRRDAAPQDTHRYHFASASEDMLNWGAGMHACPGRFFAQECLKLIFVYLLTRYEFKLSEEGNKMDKMVARGLVLVPNMGISVLFRERERTTT